jgi:hypothetical protein
MKWTMCRLLLGAKKMTRYENFWIKMKMAKQKWNPVAKNLHKFHKPKRIEDKRYKNKSNEWRKKYEK